MRTFDDRYYNNNISLPISRDYNIPEVFLTSIDYILYGNGLWWDVLYREREN